MELKGEILIAAPRHAVGDALVDPRMLARCLTNIESPAVTRTETPDGCTISGGGGFMMQVRLQDEEGGTLLSYDAVSNVGSQVARLGSAFARLKAEVEQPSQDPEPALNPANDAANNAAELAAARLRGSVKSDYVVPETLGLGRTGWLALILIVVAIAVWLTM